MQRWVITTGADPVPGNVFQNIRLLKTNFRNTLYVTLLCCNYDTTDLTMLNLYFSIEIFWCKPSECMVVMNDLLHGVSYVTTYLKGVTKKNYYIVKVCSIQIEPFQGPIKKNNMDKYLKRSIICVSWVWTCKGTPRKLWDSLNCCLYHIPAYGCLLPGSYYCTSTENKEPKPETAADQDSRRKRRVCDCLGEPSVGDNLWLKVGNLKTPHRKLAVSSRKLAINQ
jgi:hypothetical protein